MVEKLKDQENNEQAENIEIEPLTDEEVESVTGGTFNEQEAGICSISACS
jgi:hypothetical protein